MGRTRSHDTNCYCDVCRDNRPFDLPSGLYEDFLKSKVVLFVGAGVSTESHRVFPYKLYDDIREQLKLEGEGALSFPDVMSAYCAQPNGRAKLLRAIKDRLYNVNSFTELYRGATRFHQEVSTVYSLDTIITTNWDPYFELECG